MKAHVLVVGAGPSGSTAAYFLARRGVDVLLVDQKDFPREKPCGDGLTPRSVAMLRRMGLLPQLESGKYQCIRGVRIYGPSGRFVSVRFESDSDGILGHGLVVPRYELDSMMLEHAIAAGTRFLAGFKAVGPVCQGEQVIGVWGKRSGKAMKLDTELVIVATGANTSFTKAIGLVKTTIASAVAVRAYFEGVKDLGNHFEMHFKATTLPGYAWIFPVNDSVANVGVSIFPGNQKAKKVNLRRILHEFVTCNKQARPKLERAKMISLPRGSPLHMSFPTLQVYSKGALLIGEAAGLVDPLTGEGIANAMESAEIAAAIAAKSVGTEDASMESLARYDHILRQKFLPAFVRAMNFRHKFVRPIPLELLLLLARIGYLPKIWGEVPDGPF